MTNCGAEGGGSLALERDLCVRGSREVGEIVAGKAGTAQVQHLHLLVRGDGKPADHEQFIILWKAKSA